MVRRLTITSQHFQIRYRGYRGFGPWRSWKWPLKVNPLFKMLSHFGAWKSWPLTPHPLFKMWSILVHFGQDLSSKLGQFSGKNSWFSLNFGEIFHWFSLIFNEFIMTFHWFSLNFNKGVVQDLIWFSMNLSSILIRIWSIFSDFLWILSQNCSEIAQFWLEFGWDFIDFHWFFMNLLWLFTDFLSISIRG